MIAMMLAAKLPAFTCDVIRVHDGDGPLWCRSGEKERVAGIQAPDFESAGLRRRLMRAATPIPAMIAPRHTLRASCRG
ncbi:hypothetical protein [Sphingomonas sp. 2SG]|uniref:hypothetical protein n=1 Tax=Sphingomonas sp. 2SG TaxID=2502201 RepID=UPI0020162F3B|nr:hypothetical protein [Sphingomonas sp. 2SG]